VATLTNKRFLASKKMLELGKYKRGGGTIQAMTYNVTVRGDRATIVAVEKH